MSFDRIDHVALEVADLEVSIHFYTKHFGFRLYSRQTVRGGLQIAYLKLGGSILELVGEARSAVQGFHFCLIATDFDADVALLSDNGVPLVTPVHPTAAREPGEERWRRVVFKGPDGEHIEIRG